MKSKYSYKKELLLLLILLTAIMVLRLILAIRNTDEQETEPEMPQVTEMKNVYILEAEEDGLRVLYDNQVMWLPGQIDMSYTYQYLADLVITDGEVTSIRLKSSSIRGTVLAVYEGKIELKEYGEIPMTEDFRLYETYQEPREVDISRLVVGYDQAEFVAADGKLCAGIISAPPDMTKIRVVLQTTDYQGLFHQKVNLRSENGLSIIREDDMQLIPPGEYWSITEEELKTGERILVEAGDEGSVTVYSIERSQGKPSYKGVLEIHKKKEGILLINELGIEEYLCCVVPSEMPSTYEPEALKAQAVCARSYAWNQIRQGNYQAYGAHVDDSVACQVYNNIQPQESTTRAVYETAGEVAVYDEDVITAYYYSTSSGWTTTGEVWGGSTQIPYLKAKKVTDMYGNAYEAEEPWYHWTIAFGGEDYWEGVADRTEALAKTSPERVEILQQDGSYRQGRLKTIGTIEDIREGERLDGGVLHSLYIDGSKASIKIYTEYAIRSVLCEKGADVIRLDNSMVTSGALLPSGFFQWESSYKDGCIEDIHISGGGYGHGAGMSQNGANAMAAAGKSYEEILKFFYDGIIIEVKNQERDE